MAGAGKLSALKAALVGGGVEIKSALVSGAANDTDIAVTGWSWKKQAQPLACIRLEGTATYSAPSDLLSEVKKGTTDNAIQLETTDASGDKLLLIWAQKS